MIEKESTIAALFPDGLYGFFLQHGRPKAPFEYLKPDFITKMKHRVTEGRHKGNFKSAIRFSKLLFGKKDAPFEVDDHVMVYLRDIHHRFKSIDEDLTHSRYIYLDDRWIAASETYIELFDLISELSQIIHGEDRMSGRINEGRFGLSHRTVEEILAAIGRRVPVYDDE